MHTWHLAAFNYRANVSVTFRDLTTRVQLLSGRRLYGNRLEFIALDPRLYNWLVKAPKDVLVCTFWAEMHSKQQYLLWKNTTQFLLQLCYFEAFFRGRGCCCSSMGGIRNISSSCGRFGSAQSHQPCAKGVRQLTDKLSYCGWRSCRNRNWNLGGAGPSRALPEAEIRLSACTYTLSAHIHLIY